MIHKKSFSSCPQGAVTALFKGQSIEELIALSRTAEFEGADGIAIELSNLPLELRTVDNFRNIINAVALPFMFICYRNDQWLGADDEGRQRYLLRAAEAGAEVIDVMGDLYDPSPYELTRKPEAVARQKKLIAEIHARGAKVICSSHMAQPRHRAEVLAHLQEQSRRGADILKIVATANTEAEFLESVQTTLLLNRELDKPFVHLTNGKFGRLHRFLGLQLGVAITFGIVRYDMTHPQEQPTIRAFKQVTGNIHWHRNDFV